MLKLSVLTGAIVGVGLAEGVRGVAWKQFLRQFVFWVLTLVVVVCPASSHPLLLVTCPPPLTVLHCSYAVLLPTIFYIFMSTSTTKRQSAWRRCTIFGFSDVVRLLLIIAR